MRLFRANLPLSDARQQKNPPAKNISAGGLARENPAWLCCLADLHRGDHAKVGERDDGEAGVSDDVEEVPAEEASEVPA